MVHIVDAIYDHGVLKPIGPLTFPEGARVQLRVEQQDAIEQQAPSEPTNGELPTLLDRLKDFVGTVDNLPADASINLDHYLYGSPKRQ